MSLSRTALLFCFFLVASILACIAARTDDSDVIRNHSPKLDPRSAPLDDRSVEAADVADAGIHLYRIKRIGADIELLFEAVQGATYRLERKLSLTDSTWQTIDGVDDLMVTSSGPETISDPGAVNLGKAFYRVMLPNQFNCNALCFIERYAADGSVPPSPTSGHRGLSTQLQKVDVGFIVDTTGSMGGSITNFKTSLSSTIIPALQAAIPNLGIGVAAHDDFPYAGYGDPAFGDKAFYISAPPQGYVTTVTANSQTAANALTTHYGGDGPESQVPAIYKAVTGAAITWPTGSLPADAPPAGTFGALRFRSDAFPIVINITDVSHHNGKRALDKTGTNYDAALQNTYSFFTYNVDHVVTAMNSIGAKFIGVAADGGARGLGANEPYGYAAYITDKTNSNVPPSAFTPVPGCVAGQCCTAVNGAGVAPDGPGGACRSVWSINSNGTGLSTSIVNGVVAILNTAQFDVYVQAYNDQAETTDVISNFMLKVEPDPTGGTDAGTGEVCVSFPAGQLADNFTGPKALTAGADGVYDTITQVNPGPLYCFNVIPKANTTVVATPSVQTFRAWLRVLAITPNGTIVLGPDREVLFVVPPIGY